MLQRVLHPNGVATYRSPLLASINVPHAFSTRIGGVSPAPFNALNLGQPGDNISNDADSRDNVERNYALLLEAVSCESRRVVRVSQVHGCAVHQANDAAPSGTQADAIVTDNPHVALAIRVADCVPILLASRDGRFVSAVHAGWRGVVAEVLPAAVESLRARFGVDPSDLVAAIGPCIGPDHFEVGPEVAAEFERKHLGSHVIHRAGRKPHINLASAVAQQLISQGVGNSSIDTTDRCTFRDANDFFSHRRDHGRTGRMAGVIGVK